MSEMSEKKSSESLTAAKCPVCGSVSPGLHAPGKPAGKWYDPPEGRVSKLAGRLQGWLHRRRWPLWLLGNLISDLRYWSWRRQGGTHGC